MCTADGNCEEQLELEAAVHLASPIDYADKPPAGGPHNACWANWTVHAQPLADEVWVHNLEHGGVVLLYNCSDCTAEVAQLQAFVQAHPRTLLTPYPEMAHRFGVVAWGYRLLSDSLDGDALARFYEAHFDHAPESLANPPTAACR